ncbi:LysM peptidoglycan-binding domain-containing protein [Mariniblastus fucicola]|uniref:LysM domain/BON superfamily protein n=1 Tax=Mariniblastus fucicola TaxID=980251 RepID=A0A5B9PEP4_9BACT|nr:hypothetical protein [Mariniblastus fucicola]QEG23640.1 LysM domain/BON superfamily protein [Mariniblastus fucicola]
MGSFQQILMGATCLAAAFFFGSYLHNRPAENEQEIPRQAATADPLDSILAFGKRPVSHSPALNTHAENLNTLASLQPSPVVSQVPASHGMPAIDPSERVPVVSSTTQPVKTQRRNPSVVPAATRKPVVPDFSELASRFRSTPLALSEETGGDPEGVVHESERVPFSNVFEAPKMVVRQPENAQPENAQPEKVQPFGEQPGSMVATPLRDIASEVDRIEDSIRGEFSAVVPDSGRWRVNRDKAIDQFRSVGQTPKQDNVSRETIEDVISRRSADWLKEDQSKEASRETWATNPPRDSWTKARRHEVTQQAARRNRDILDIEDPGNRFQSVLTEPEEMAPPAPETETAYYTPTQQRQDSLPPRRQPQHRLRPVNVGVDSNWSHRSNIQSQFANRYTIQPGDTLQSISIQFYGSADYYVEIYKANREVLDRITASPAGIEIEIPNLNN